MAIKAEEIVTDFKGNTKELDKAFRYVERETGLHLTKVENLYRNAQGKLVAASNAIPTGGGGFLPGLANISEIIQGLPQIGRLAGALISPLTSAAEAGIKFNAFLETSKIGFETMLGSGKKAQDFLDQLQSFAAKTPFQFEDLVGASQRMLAFGFSAKQILPILTNVGDAVSSTGAISKDAIDGVLMALGQMQTKGKVSTEEMNQLAERGIPAWDLLSQAIGKTKEQTMKLAEAGRLKGAPAVEAISAMMGQRFGGQMGRVSGTLTGRLSNLQDLQQQAQGLATQGLTKDISEIFGAAQDNGGLVSSMAQKINDLLTPVSGLIKTTAVGILGGGLTSGLMEGLDAGKAAVATSLQSFAVETILGTAKKYLGIESPSKEFREIGLMSARGYNDGFIEGMDGAQGGMLGALGGFENSILQRRRPGAYQGQNERQYLEGVLDGPQGGLVRAFFEAIKRAEGGRPDVMAGGRRVDSGALHPGEVVPMSQWFRTSAGPSSAAGDFQITRTNWRNLAPRLGLDNFSDERQQLLAAMSLFNGRGGLDQLLSGNIDAARGTAAKDWTSTPGSTIGGGRQLSVQRWMSFFNQAMSGGAGSFASSTSVPGSGGNGLGGILGAWKQYDRQNPMPVQVIGPSGEALGAGDWFNTQASRTINDNVPVNVDVMAEPDKLSDSVARAATGMSLFLRPVQEAEDKLNQLGEGQWADLVIGQSEKAARRMSMHWSDAASGFEEIMGSAFTNVFEDGFAKSAGNMLVSFAQLIQQMAMRAAAARITDALFGSGSTEEGGKRGGFLGTLLGWGISAVGSALGGAAMKGSIGAGGWTGPGSVSVGGGGLMGVSGLIPRAGGGDVIAGRPYMVGEESPELFVPRQSGRIFNQQQMGGMGGVTVVNHFHVAAPGGMVPKQTQAQMARAMISTLNHEQQRRG